MDSVSNHPVQTKILVSLKLPTVTLGASQNACNGVKRKVASLVVNTFGTKATEVVMYTLPKLVMEMVLETITVGFVMETSCS